MTVSGSDRLQTPRPAVRRRPRLLRPAIVIPVLVVGTLLTGVLAYLFQPWKLWVDDVVDEAPPAAASTVVAAGRFVSHEHETTGTVRVLRLPDGSRVLRVEDLETSNGPALRVWITDASVLEGRDGWFVFDDGRHVDLGELRGNVGSQNYALPSGVDLVELHSVSIWCERFHVSFGAAELHRRSSGP
ncbi:MAG: DM13 domain-containing protein [Nocardioidaceae bacterium]